MTRDRLRQFVGSLIGTALVALTLGYRRWGWGIALYETSPLQRRLRDIHAVTQHTLAHHKHFATAGRLRLGFPLERLIYG